jgi:hypothetical protein
MSGSYDFADACDTGRPGYDGVGIPLVLVGDLQSRDGVVLASRCTGDADDEVGLAVPDLHALEWLGRDAGWPAAGKVPGTSTGTAETSVTGAWRGL